MATSTFPWSQADHALSRELKGRAPEWSGLLPPRVLVQPFRMVHQEQQVTKHFCASAVGALVEEVKGSQEALLPLLEGYSPPW